MLPCAILRQPFPVSGRSRMRIKIFTTSKCRTKKSYFSKEADFWVRLRSMNSCLFTIALRPIWIVHASIIGSPSPIVFQFFKLITAIDIFGGIQPSSGSSNCFSFTKSVMLSFNSTKAMDRRLFSTARHKFAQIS